MTKDKKKNDLGLESVNPRLAKDVKATAADISREEASGLVDLYYTMQEHRIALGNQSHAAEREMRPHSIPDYFGDQFGTLERQMKGVLDTFVHSQPVGRWALDQIGIGPVLAAGLLAHIDITRAPTVGHIWSFAGLNPDAKWEKGQKRPWNARLKTLCWKVGDSLREGRRAGERSCTGICTDPQGSGVGPRR